jgi:hypothetical protein
MEVRMKHRLLMTRETSCAPGTSEHRCPRCAAHLIRVRRRVVDRLLSLFVPVHRYECSHYCCGWKGSIRVRSGVAETLSVRVADKGLAS